jgi:hypothetical protein
MAKKYCLPTNRNAAAATAPARLAEECGYAVWRDRPDGGLEVVTVRDGCLHRHLVHDDGTTSLIERELHGATSRWATLSYAGFGFNMLVLVGVAAGRLPGAAFMLFFIGMAVMAVGTLAHQRQTDPVSRLRRTPETAGDWHEPSRLSGWAPRTSAQLRAVEELANEHNGVARVRDLGGDTVDVAVRRWGRRLRFVVDSSGYPSRTDSFVAEQSGPWLEIRTIEEDRD